MASNSDADEAEANREAVRQAMLAINGARKARPKKTDQKPGAGQDDGGEP
jgi:hypothetical protein